MTPEEYVATLKPRHRGPQTIGEYWAHELGLSPAPDDIEGWHDKRDVTLDDGQIFPYGLIVEAAVSDVTMTPEAAETFLTAVDRLRNRVNAYVTPDIAVAAVVQILGQEKRSQHVPPLDPSRATILNWALGRIPESEQRVATVRTGLDNAPRSLSTGMFLRSTPAVIELIEDPAVKAAAKAHVAESRNVSRPVAAARRDRALGRGTPPRPGDGPDQSGGGPPTGGFPKQPRRQL